jgi:hypothetical protein
LKVVGISFQPFVPITFIISDLPDCVDEQGKVTFVKRLVKEGLAVPETHLT